MLAAGRPRSSCIKFHEDKKKCSPILQFWGTCTSCHWCREKGTICSFGHTIYERGTLFVQKLSKEQSSQEPSKKLIAILGDSAQPSVLPAKRRRIIATCSRNGDADKSGRATLLPPLSLTCLNHNDEFKDEEADRSGRASPLPSDFYSAQDGFNIEEGFEDGDAEGSGRAIPLPPDSNSILNMSNISEHPKFKSLLEVCSSCKGSRILFEYVFGSSKVIPYTDIIKHTYIVSILTCCMLEK